MKTLRSARQAGGFSLVEVVMALGVISFAMVGMLGLLSVGFAASKKATVDNNLSMMSSQLVGFLRTNTSSSYAHASMSAATMSFYFDGGGKLQMTASDSGVLLTTSNSSSVYECAVQTRSAPASLLASGTYSLMVLTFSWPLTVTATSRRSQEVFYATMPK